MTEAKSLPPTPLENINLVTVAQTIKGHFWQEGLGGHPLTPSFTATDLAEAIGYRQEFPGEHKAIRNELSKLVVKGVLERSSLEVPPDAAGEIFCYQVADEAKLIAICEEQDAPEERAA